jgi:hypothetical protein
MLINFVILTYLINWELKIQIFLDVTLCDEVTGSCWTAWP